MRIDKQTVWAAIVLLAVAFVVSVAKERRATQGGTGGGGEPTYAVAQPEFVEQTHPIAPVDLGATPRDSWEIPPADPEAVRSDMGLDGRVVIRRFDARGPELTVVAYAGGPILQDPQAPDPSVQKTYLPEKPQVIPQGEDCVFWFSPYLQLTLQWDIRVVDGSRHVVLTGSWYRKTYARRG